MNSWNTPTPNWTPMGSLPLVGRRYCAAIIQIALGRAALPRRHYSLNFGRRGNAALPSSREVNGQGMDNRK